MAIECATDKPLKVFFPQYAKHFLIEYFLDFKILNVDGERYLLKSKKNENLCHSVIPQLMTPVSRVVLMSTTYLHTLELLKQEKTLIGFQGIEYIVSPVFNLSEIKEVSFKFNTEELLGLKADLIMGYESNLVGKNQKELFHSLGIPVVINKDYEEESSLGRAEWMIFNASFYDKEEESKQLFFSIQKKYNELKEKNKLEKNKAKVIVGEIQNGFWVTCGEKSDLGQLIKDAGGELSLSRASSNTQKMSLEILSQNKTVFDIWLTHNNWLSQADREAMFTKDKRYKLIKTKNIFNNNLLMNKAHYSDFWESGMQRPDLLLLELSALFHPESYKNHQFRWYRQL